MTADRRLWNAKSFLAFMLMAVMLISAVAAANNLSNVTPFNGSTAAITATDFSTSTLGGGATAVDLTFITQSLRWQGWYGDVAHNVELTDGVDLFFDWTQPVPEGEIFATTASSVDWSLIQCADYSTVQTEQVISGTGSDRVNLTFADANVNSFKVGDTDFGVGVCDYASFTIDSTGAPGTYEEVLLESQNNLIYTAIVSAGGSSFTGQPADFQMLVAEDGTDDVPTTYYFYAELQ
jgi:hypothetical protein